MKKIFNLIGENILFLITIFLLIFIPLFPKLPILDVRNTWVSIRAEDFLVFIALTIWFILLLKKKVTLRTPLTLPILFFWIVGLVATLHGVLIVFPTLHNVFPNVAFLSLVRHIEYLSLFFVAFYGMRDKRLLPIVIWVLVFTLIAVAIYGFGQRYLQFPAFLTMNEEFAKGVPIYLSRLSRIPSTFAGHYDLAAYLVLMIPIIFSLVFGFKNWFIKLFLLGTAAMGFVLLFMTVSRVSFFVLFISILVVLFFQKKKLVLLLIPVVAILGIFFVTQKSSLLDRFKDTVVETDVLVDADTGASLGNITFVNKDYFNDKLVLQHIPKNNLELEIAIANRDKEQFSDNSLFFPSTLIPEQAVLTRGANLSNGEDLTQGTGYTNLYLSPVTKRIKYFFFEPGTNYNNSSSSAEILAYTGSYLIKKASTYDLSFTTRFQGEWPRALEAFQKNILIGSGYGSVSLAVDNNYLRILGEVGILGFVAFFGLFLTLAIYIKKIYPDIDNRVAQSFIVGFGAGLIGLALNATLIDVFEASKIAFMLWMLFGITFGLLALYQKKEINLLEEVKKVAFSNYAIILYLFIFCFILFSPMLANYFVGDDFTWLRWAADCKENCSPIIRSLHYFTNSDGFFYRPGAKIYFEIMYKMFWLNQIVYHLVSLILHFGVASLLFIFANKILKNKLMAAGSAFLFLIMSGSGEAIFWIASVGHLFTIFFGILALLLFIKWDEKRKIYYFIASIISLFLSLTFHELGMVFPLLIVLWGFMYGNLNLKKLIKRVNYLIIFMPDVIYLIVRYLSQSHWLSGDYNYNFILLPFNFVGNAVGYALLTLMGTMSLPIYSILRTVMRGNIIGALIVVPVVIVISYFIYRLFNKFFTASDKRVIVFGFLFFVISLLPFLGLGNITSRYNYLASFGLILILMIIFKKIYEYLQDSGREIAIGIMFVLIGVFSIFHIIQMQQTLFNWQDAGNMTRQFFISAESAYTESWSRKDAEFNLINVPLRIGEAWIFPVGLQDALWFAFRNGDAKVNTYTDKQAALDQAGFYLSRPVLEFKSDGSVKEVNRFKNVPVNMIKP